MKQIHAVQFYVTPTLTRTPTCFTTDSFANGPKAGKVLQSDEYILVTMVTLKNYIVIVS